MLTGLGEEPAEGLDHALDGADGGDRISRNIHAVVRVLDDDGFADRRHLHRLQHDRIELRIGRADDEQGGASVLLNLLA